MRLTCYLGIIALALLSALPAPAQENTLAEALAGKTNPLSLTLKQLDGTWCCVTPVPATNAADAFVQMATMQMSQRAWAPEVIYTRGETLVLAGETYLIAYARPPLPMPTREDIQRGNRAGVKPEPLTPDTEVFLTLLNLHTMGDLLDIQPFDLQHMLAADVSTTMKEAQTRTLNNLRQLAMATAIYAQENANKMPPMDTIEHWQVAIKIDVGVMTQPGTGEPYRPNAALNNKTLGQIANPGQTVVAYEQHPWPDGRRGVAFCDARVELVNDQRWQQLHAAMAPDEKKMTDAQTQSLNNLLQLAIATLAYTQDNDEQFPPMDTFDHWKAALNLDGGKELLDGGKVFLQPGTREPYQPNPALSKKDLGEIQSPEKMVIAYEQHPWPDGRRGVAFCDGHVEMADAQRWQQLHAAMAPAHR